MLCQPALHQHAVGTRPRQILCLAHQNRPFGHHSPTAPSAYGNHRSQTGVPRAASTAEIAQQAASDVSQGAEDSSSEQKIRIKLKSYWTERLSEAVEQIKDAARSTKAQFSGPVYLPTRRRRWCVLTSPHVNKDAREQFEIRTHQRLIDVKDLTADTIDKLMNLDLPAGVDVEIKL